MPDIYSILDNNDFQNVVNKLCVDTIDGRAPREYLEEYNGERKRRKASVGWREPKRLEVYSDTLKDKNGKPLRLDDRTVDVARIVTNFPKKEIRTSVAFMFGGRMNLIAEEQNDGFEEFKRVWEKKLRMHARIKEFARVVLCETKAAFVFYPYVTHDMEGNMVAELRVKILSTPTNPNEISDFYPHFDDNDDMDGFIHKYQVKGDDGVTRDQTIIWTRESIIKGTQTGTGWEVKKVPNIFGKIPVVYAETDRPEWDDVATLMDAREMRLSRTADTNDYFAEPILKTFGLSDLPGKNTVGKEIAFPIKIDDYSGKEIHGDAEFLDWEQSIGSVEKELEETKNELFSGSSTPDLSFDNLKGVGNVSGVARRFMTLDAQIKASENMEIFDPAIQRCVSVVIAGISNITNIKYRDQLQNNWITVSFESILPKDPLEDAQFLNFAGGGKPFNSIETIVSRSPITPPGDLEGEMKRMEEDAARESERNSMVGMTAFGG